MSVGFDDGKVKWEPPADAAGTHDVEIEVEDLFGGSSTYRFALQLSYQTQQEPVAANPKPAKASATEAPAEPLSDVETAAHAPMTWSHRPPQKPAQPVPADQESESGSRF